MICELDNSVFDTANRLTKELNTIRLRRILANDVEHTGAMHAKDIALEDTDYGRCAKRYVLAYDEFRRMTLEISQSKAVEVANTVHPLMTKLLGSPFPGPVTLSLGDTGLTETWDLKELVTIKRRDNGEIDGIVNVSDLRGRSHTTKCFYIKNNHPYFMEDISL